MPVKKEIVYPFFLECCQFACDSFWETIFEDLSYGIVPYGTYINKDYLCCSCKNKEFSYKIERKDPKLMYDEIYNLLSGKLGILSYKEKQRKRIDYNQLEKEIKESRQKWTDIKKKNIKDYLIEQYVIMMKKKHSLDISQTKFLLSLITLALVTKIIGTKDITYENGKIVDIRGIKITTDGKVSIGSFLSATNGNESIFGHTSYSPEKKVNEVNLLSDNWEKQVSIWNQEKSFKKGN